MSDAIRFEIDPTGQFKDAVKTALQKVDDLRPAWAAIVPSWFKSNKAIFALKSPGKYADLSAKYKASKRLAVGFVYPILRRSGLLEKSLTVPGDPDSIVRMTKTDMDLGTANPIAPALHYGAVVPMKIGTRFLPPRPIVMIGTEQTAPEEINMRRKRWIQTVENYVLQMSSPLGETK